MERDLQQMPHLRPLGLEVFLVVRVGRGADRDHFDDLQPVAFEADDFFRVVGQEAHFPHAEIDEDLRAEAVVAQLRREAEFFVGLHGVEALLLEFVGVDLGRQADAAAFLRRM